VRENDSEPERESEKEREREQERERESKRETERGRARWKDGVHARASEQLRNKGQAA